MARVTVEDCVTKVPNRFELVMLASQRARNISAGAELTVERDRDKNPVIALREIAEETIDRDELEEALIKGLQKFVEMDEPEEDEVDLIAIQQEFNPEAQDGDGNVPSGDDKAMAMDIAGDAFADDIDPEDEEETETEEEEKGA